jgi:hypothetical protein
VVFAGLLLCLGVFAQSPGKIEIGKMNPAGLLVDKYRYMAQPYSFYYFHHMDLLGLRTDWIQKAKGVYPLREPARQVVIVQTSAWPEPVSPLLEQEQKTLFDKIAGEIVP